MKRPYLGDWPDVSEEDNEVRKVEWSEPGKRTKNEVRALRSCVAL